MQALAAVDEHIATLTSTGASRALIRQRRWALNQAITAAALSTIHGPAPTPDMVASTPAAVLEDARTQLRLDAILNETFWSWYGPWSGTGALATRPAAGTSAASARARISALRALSASHSLLPGPAHTHPGPTPRATFPTRAADDILTVITQAAPRGPATTRLAALLAVAATTPARPHAMCAMNVDDLIDSDNGHITLTRPPDGGQPATLTGARADALRAWLTTRASLVDALTGTPPTAVWVAVRAHMTPQGVVRPAGLPLHPRGFERAYAKAVRRLNLYLARRPELIPHHLNHTEAGPLVPLPVSFEILRRSLGRTAPSVDLG